METDTCYETKMTLDDSVMVRTLSPGGPGGPSFPELPWRDKIRSKWWTCTTIYARKVVVKYFTHLWSGFSCRSSWSSLSSRSLEEKTKWLKSQRRTWGIFVTWKLRASAAESVSVPLEHAQVEPPLLLRCQAGHLYLSMSLLSKTNRWSSLSAWARLPCCSLWTTKNTHNDQRSGTRIIKRLHAAEGSI